MRELMYSTAERIAKNYKEKFYEKCLYWDSLMLHFAIVH